MEDRFKEEVDLIAKVITDNIQRVAENHFTNENKIIVFVKPECSHCEEMGEELTQYDNYFKGSEDYIPYELFDVSIREYYDFAKMLKFKGIPTIAFVGSDNKIKALKGGVVKASDLMLMANKILK